jgi:hypothetical protein
MKKSPKPAVPAVDRQEETVVVRMTLEQKRAFTAEAKRRGLNLSSWIRMTLLEKLQGTRP